MVERLAKCDFAGIAREGPGFLSLMLTAYAVYLESVVERVTAESRRQRRLVKAVCVVDMEQYGLSHLWHINTFKPFTSIGPTYYPEFTTRVLIGALCNRRLLALTCLCQAFAQMVLCGCGCSAGAEGRGDGVVDRQGPAAGAHEGQGLHTRQGQLPGARDGAAPD